MGFAAMPPRVARKVNSSLALCPVLAAQPQKKYCDDGKAEPYRTGAAAKPQKRFLYSLKDSHLKVELRLTHHEL
jgi:hypothetical protein